ncbi:hypothetical protein [Chelativorans sp.]|uniref:hypothetical protein n=1 Tax=Chelativorans sp. TaxID=2203393 RepID=UPI0028110179|nr:hypothetical protein [Chelativorans sp.]
MRLPLAITSFLTVAGPAGAQEIASAYTELNPMRDCTVYASAAEGDGDWSNLVCSGYKGFPVFIHCSDARESLFYGFPPQGRDLAWESFSAFNNAGPKIEWRVERDGTGEKPFAAIHRWFVSANPEEPDRQIEVLVVHKVGRIGEWQGCAVGYVVATGNRDANAQARRIADDKARSFACGSDQPVTAASSIPLPDFTRSE